MHEYPIFVVTFPATTARKTFFGTNLGHLTRTIYTNLGFPFPRRLHINLAMIGQAVSEEKMLENGERQRQQRRRSMGIL